MVRSGAQNRKGAMGTTAVAQSPKSPTARVRLGDVCKINYGERVRKVDSSGDAFPVYGGGGETFRWAFANRVDKCVISRFAMSRECVRFVKGRFFLNDSGLTVESVDKSLNQDFLDWFLIGSQEKIYACGQGAAQRNLDIRRFRDLLVPIPTKEEQSCVVFKLDKISRLITLRKRQLSKLDELVKSRFVEMFGDKGFPTRSWDRVFDATTGKLDSNAATEDGVYPFFTCAKSPLHIDYYAFDCEALLLAGNNAAGIYDVKYYKGKFNAYQRTYVLRLKDSNWQYVVFKTQLESKLAMLQSASKGTMTKYLTMGILKALQFVVPDNSLQREFAAFVEKVDKLAFKAKASLEKLETLKKAMMQKYFN